MVSAEGVYLHTRDGRKVIRVGRMAQPKKDGNSEDDPDRGSVGGRGDPLVEAEHPDHLQQDRPGG